MGRRARSGPRPGPARLPRRAGLLAYRGDVTRTAYELAALVSAAVPGLSPVSTVRLAGDPDYECGLVTDDRGGRWTIKVPTNPTAGTHLEAESHALGALSGGVRSTLPFEVPRVAGCADLDEGGRAAAYPTLSGETLDLARVVPGGDLARSLGRALGRLHELPVSLVEGADLPVYTSAECRDRWLTDLDQAAATGRVPAVLLDRWERRLQDVGLWRFPVAVVHGDLAPETVVVAGDRVSAVSDWSQLHVGDPAEDLAWLAAGLSPEAFDTVIESYALGRRADPDPGLADRSGLLGELALVRWYLHGVTRGDDAVVADALHLMADLEADVTAPEAEAGDEDAAGPGVPEGPEDPGTDVDPAVPDDRGDRESGTNASS